MGCTPPPPLPTPRLLTFLHPAPLPSLDAPRVPAVVQIFLLRRLEAPKDAVVVSEEAHAAQLYSRSGINAAALAEAAAGACAFRGLAAAGCLAAGMWAVGQAAGYRRRVARCCRRLPACPSAPPTT